MLELRKESAWGAALSDSCHSLGKKKKKINNDVRISLARCIQSPGALSCRYLASFTSPVPGHRSPPPARGRGRHGSSDGAGGAERCEPGARRVARWRRDRPREARPLKSEQRAGIGADAQIGVEGKLPKKTQANRVGRRLRSS